MIQPDRALRARHLVAQVHAAAKRPAHLELANRAVFETDQRDAVVLGLYRMDERVGPAHHLDRANVLADEAAHDLDAVAPQVDDGAAAGLLKVPEPVTVRAGMRLARAGPGDVAQRTVLHRCDRLQRLGRIAQVLQVTAEHAGRFDLVHHPFGLGRVAPQRLGAEDRLARGRGQVNALFVNMIWQPDDDGIDRVRRTGRRQIGRPFRNPPLVRERACPLLRA